MTIKEIRGYITKTATEATQLDDEWIILNTEDYTITKVNEIGGFCWSMLSTYQTVSSIVQAIEKKYSSEHANKEDITRFLADLMKYELIEYAH